MATKLDRQTVDLSGYPDMVVVYLGMRVRKPKGLLRLLGIGPQIQKSWKAQPDGLLLHEDIIWSLIPPHIGMRQYWRDYDTLEAWTRSEPHQKWWRDFMRDAGGTGFWHEAYFMARRRRGDLRRHRQAAGLRDVRAPADRSRRDVLEPPAGRPRGPAGRAAGDRRGGVLRERRHVRVDFDLDQHPRVDQRADLDHRVTGGSAEDLAVGAPDVLPARDVGDEDARAHDVGERRADQRQRRPDVASAPAAPARRRRPGPAIRRRPRRSPCSPRRHTCARRARRGSSRRGLLDGRPSRALDHRRRP